MRKDELEMQEMSTKQDPNQPPASQKMIIS